ncbi:hypothetical protein VOLCADRAFT_106990 [Volvox carteri f. nagariensis]|uniref:LRAT domain-containing protein n=1 Tax=Volvox carteri f. nagariensis TaxID=3068 RepID=D8UB80_VOLCA|nr:uncharacterized protein VOLCADRAFT_106990 [Volvox carteri f. nagariensis]EFJ43124.1 hypothetical protein VOLCADRAFT_106990 [Volvox carteri f. nagariensis]|eukprot:XP_002955923.1 hypothetical protein VOLCADRAFT_106990 [Volvox carteri f. nagariensis]
MAHSTQASVESQFRLLQTSLRATEVDLTPRNYKEFGPCRLGTAPAGSHIVVQIVRGEQEDVIWHHGIYLGDYMAAHMHPDGNISIVTIEKFMGMERGAPRGDYVGKAGIVEYAGDNDTLRNKTCIFARWAAADKDGQQIVYNALSSNCEWFATLARTGRGSSEQVDRVVRVVARLLSNVAVAMVEYGKSLK